MSTGLFQRGRSAIRMLTSPSTWGLVAYKDGPRLLRSDYRPPEFRVGAPEEGTGLVEVGFDDARIWQPAGGDLDILKTIHREIFDESHPHHYEHGEGRLRPGDVAFDVGSCEGFFTRFALDRGARLVVAVEPWSLQVKALRRTFAPEIEAGRVRVARVALADRDGELELQINPSHPWGAGLASVYGSTLTETVRVTTLDSLVEEIGEGCDFIKADVEGSELKLLDGATGTLGRLRPRLAMAAYHRPTDYLEMRRRVRAAEPGYTVVGKGLLRRAGLPYPTMMHAW